MMGHASREDRFVNPTSIACIEYLEFGVVDQGSRDINKNGAGESLNVALELRIRVRSNGRFRVEKIRSRAANF